MEHEEKLTALIKKYKANRDALPLEVLKTAYRVPFEKLVAEIKQELQAIATKLPPDIGKAYLPKEQETEICNIFNDLYKTGGYAEKLGTAAFRDKDAAAAIQIAHEIAVEFTEKVKVYLSEEAKHDKV